MRIDWYASWPFQVRSWPWPEVKLSTWLFKVKLYIIRRGSIRETRCWQKKCCVSTESKFITEKTFIAKNGYFWKFCSLEAKPLILDQIWGHVSERALKELSNELLRSTVSLLVPELCASLSKNVEIGQIWPLVTSGDLTFDLTLKVTRSSFVMIFDALSNAAYRVSLRGPGAEIEGGVLNNPPPSSRWWKI